VGAWLDEWLETSVAARCRPSTARSYRDVAALYIRPAIGMLPLAKLEPEHIASMLTRLTTRGDLSSTTVRYAYAVLRIALARALKSGRVIRNVATLIDPPGGSAASCDRSRSMSLVRSWPASAVTGSKRCT